MLDKTIETVVITEKTIVLGIFGTPTFNYFKRRGAYLYGQEPIFDIDIEYSVVENVRRVLPHVDKVIFVLDEVKFPINVSESITCGELKIVCEYDEFFSKTVFVKGNNVIDFDKNLL